jgi:protein tyrosine phosphatase
MPTAAAAGVSGLGGCGLVLPGREEMQAEFEQLERVSGRPPSGLAEIAARYPSATRPENFPKNRWRDVLPYEETRVRLKRPSGSDYINASYIKPPGEERERYIACQAPLPSTVEDFWYMLLQERVRLVVMLTRLVERERPKACRYWPESEQEPLLFSSGLEVQLLNLEPGRAGKVTVRHLRVRASPSEPWHELHHLHYEDWPDFGVPESTQPARHLLHRLDALDAEYARAGAAPAPIVMHCSAGIGRTGTLIAIHASIASWRAGRGLDVPGCVASMRAQRAGMVQTADQYAFIYRVLKDFLQDCLQAERIQRLIAAMPPPSRSPHAHHRSSTDALSFRIKKQLSLPVFGPPPTSPLLRRPRHLTSSPSSPPSGAPERPHSLSHSIPAIRLSLLSPLPNHSL